MGPDVRTAGPCVVVHAENFADLVVLESRCEDVGGTVATGIGNQDHRSVYTCVGNLGESEVQRLEIGQTFKVHESCVGDLGILKTQRLELGQSL